MNQKDKLKLAGIDLFTDRVGIDHIRYGRGVRGRVKRFARVQGMLMRADHRAPGVRAGRLVGLELVRPVDLQEALAAAPYSYRGEACIEWGGHEGVELDRRVLSSLTVCAWNVPADGNHDEVEALADLVKEIPGFRDLGTTDILLELELDQACWASQHLPKPLWAHVVGQRRFTPLPRNVLANEHPLLVPQAQIDEERCRRGAEAADMLDTAVLAGRRSEVMPATMELASKVFKMSSKETKAETLTRWGKSLIALRAHVERGDVAAAIVVAWNYDLVENGTITDSSARLETRARYARVANARLWRMISSLPQDISKWTREELSAGYLAMMADQSCNDLQGLGAAISSFQVFLQETFGIQPLRLGLHKLIPEPRPRAQWISDFALKRTVRWLDADEKGDPRLKAICALMLSLAYAGPFRLNELRWLRLLNIFIAEDGTAEIEVTALPGSSAIKTDAGKRRIPINNLDAVRRLSQWIEKRQSEGCPTAGLLFGEAANDHKPYRAHAVHTTLLALLRQSTGDADITFHALRHTYISNAMEEILWSSNTGMNNRLSQLADWAGHEVAVTTIKFYSHRFEFPLRSWLDSRLLPCPATNADGERLLSIKANTLTQFCRRHTLDLSGYIWKQVGSAAGKLVQGLPAILSGVQQCEAAPLRLTGPMDRQFTVGDCLTILEQLSKDINVNLLEHRYGITADQRAAIDRAAVDVAAQIYATRERLCPRYVVDAKGVFAHFDLDFERARAQTRYAKFVEALRLPISVQLVSGATKAWTASWWRGELNAAPPTRILPILQLLKACEVSAQSLLLRVETDEKNLDAARKIEAEAAAVAAAVFNDHLAVSRLQTARRGRPQAYLLWPSRVDVGPAGKSNEGFDVLMLAAAIWASPAVQDWAGP